MTMDSRAVTELTGDAEPPIGNIQWETAADALCKAIMAPAARTLRAATDEVYASLLDDLQAYLLENATFNLGEKLRAATREAAEAREQLSRVAEALGTFRQGWPSGPRPKDVADEAIARIGQLRATEGGVGVAERASIIAGLKERAVWLRDEASKGGSSDLRIRAEEAEGVAGLIERGRFSAEGRP